MSNVPYKCPTCGGIGRLKYDPMNPFARAPTNAGPWMCPPCLGSGIVWSKPPTIMRGDDKKRELTESERAALDRALLRSVDVVKDP